MRDLEHSLNLNFSRLNSMHWHSINEEMSQDCSSINRGANQCSNLLFSMPNEPPRPANSLYSCIESDSSENSDIKEVPYLPNETEPKMVRHVNQKQYFRIMKRRVKKGLQQVAKGQADLSGCSNGRKKYMHESRHKHAVTRARGKDGKFLPTRPAEERFREKKKRGRKPKYESQSPKNESTALKQVP